MTNIWDKPEAEREAIFRASPLVWTIHHVLLPKAQVWDFESRPWLVPIIEDTAREIVVRKATQVGLTTAFSCKVLHLAYYHPVTVMYTLPRQDDVTAHTTTKLDPILEGSPLLRAVMGAGIDSARRKKFKDSFIHVSEASVPPRMIDADAVVNDEVDFSDQDNIAQYEYRLSASQYKIHHRLSTPSVPGFGIDALFTKSTQNYWNIQCVNGHEQILDWDQNLEVHGDEAKYVCHMCRREITPQNINDGRWVPASASAMLSGYHISQMMATWLTPTELWQSFQKATAIKFFYNFVLGMPYQPLVGSFTRGMFLENCFRHSYERHVIGKGYYMAFDQGNDLFAAIGKVDAGVLKVVHLETIPFESERGFGRLHDLMRFYGIRFAVGDALPNMHPARELSKAFSGRVALAFYPQAYIRDLYQYNKGEGTLSINRTEALDGLRDDVQAGRIALYGRAQPLDKEVDALVGHCCNMRRDEELRRMQGGDKIFGVWRSVGPDHFAHVLSYLRLAVALAPGSGFRVTTVGSGEPVTEEVQPKTAQTEVKQCQNCKYYREQNELRFWCEEHKCYYAMGTTWAEKCAQYVRR